jgi:CDP-paratose 2-epimerase
VAHTVFITGGAGFVGSNLALRLKQGHPDWRIVAFDNLRRRGSELNFDRLRQGGVEFLHGDIRTPDDFPAYRIDVLIDAAAEPSVQAGLGGDSPRYVVDTNLVGLVNCLEVARRHGSDLLFLSTSRIYPVDALNQLRVREEETRFALEPEQPFLGASEHGIAEEFPLEGSRSIYGATKLCAELMIEEYREAFGLRTAITRFGVITGPWQMGKVDQGVFALWMAAHVFGHPLRYIGWGGTGKQVRDFLHVEDLCDLVELQLGSMDRFNGRTFNAGGGLEVSLSLLETTRLCREIAGTEVPVTADPENRRADLKLYVADCRRLTEHSGWRPRRSAETTLSDIHRWMVENRALLQPVFAR